MMVVPVNSRICWQTESAYLKEKNDDGDRDIRNEIEKQKK